jgi:hypothetical protein
VNATSYTLTVRREAMLAIFSNQTRFDLFARNNERHTKYAAFFLLGTVITLFNVFGYSDPIFPLLLCTAGFGYQSWKIYKDYRGARECRVVVNAWVAEAERFQSHSIVMGEDHFSYVRDGEASRYDLSRVKEKFHNEKVFILKLTDKSSLVIPAEAFQSGRFDQFTAGVDEIMARIQGISPAPNAEDNPASEKSV